MRTVMLATVGTLMTAVAMAQTSAGPAGSGPADPRAPVSPLEYHSPFAQYRPFAEATAASWKAVNDDVAQIGGWKAYAREANEAATSAAAADKAMPTPQSVPAPDGTPRKR